MPAPVTTASKPGKEPFTHRVKLLNGETYTMLNPARPASPWKFVNNVPQNVPASVAKALKERAVDAVTVTAGKNVSQQFQQKFDIVKIGDKPAAEEAPAE